MWFDCLSVYTDVRDDEGQSPLNKALNGNDGGVDVALYLMSRGCACGDEDKAKALCEACVWGKLNVVKELVQHHKVDPKSECDNIILLLIKWLTFNCGEEVGHASYILSSGGIICMYGDRKEYTEACHQNLLS